MGGRTRTSFLAASIEVARPLRLAAEFSPQTSSAACLSHSCSEESAAAAGCISAIAAILLAWLRRRVPQHRRNCCWARESLTHPPQPADVFHAGSILAGLSAHCGWAVAHRRAPDKMQALPKPDYHPPVPVGERLPPQGQRVIVITAGFRCLGYLDEHGAWRHHFNKSEIKDAVAWTEQA